MAAKKTTEQFIEEAKKVHGNKYDYSLTNYLGAYKKVKIICNNCRNIFEQVPHNHLEGTGCPYCSKRVKKTIKDFIQNSRQIHGDKYDYNLVKEFKNNKTKVKIICKKCNKVFEQNYSNHISHKKGCPFCANNIKLTTEQFINKAEKIHGDKYNYNLVDYINNHTKIKIICKKHSIFEQSPDHHLLGNCCPLCNNSVNELKIENFLKEKK